MLEVKPIPRIFKATIDGNEMTLSDPNPELTPKQVIEHYANMYPEITNSKLDAGKIEDDTLVFNINNEKGQHG
jgi:PRTRC genetic system protein C